MLSYRRETALQGALQFSPKVEDWNWDTIFYGHYRSPACERSAASSSVGVQTEALDRNSDASRLV